MTSPISGGMSPISAIAPITPTTPSTSVGAAGEVSATGGSDFASALGKGVDAVTNAQGAADNLAMQAATGQAVDPAAVTVAMTQAQLMTQLITTVQSKAVTSFNTIMGMQA